VSTLARPRRCHSTRHRRTGSRALGERSCYMSRCGLERCTKRVDRGHQPTVVRHCNSICNACRPHAAQRRNSLTKGSDITCNRTTPAPHGERGSEGGYRFGYCLVSFVGLEWIAASRDGVAMGWETLDLPSHMASWEEYPTAAVSRMVLLQRVLSLKGH
jgi:hypothetical protein